MGSYTIMDTNGKENVKDGQKKPQKHPTDEGSIQHKFCIKKKYI